MFSIKIPLGGASRSVSRFVIASLLAGSVLLAPVAAQAKRCTGTADCGLCAKPICNTIEGVWDCNPKPAGTSCNDGNLCNSSEQCDGNGNCVGTAIQCPPPDQCHSAPSCNPATGACSNPVKPDGTACNDGNACTQTDTCQGGVCTGGNPVQCSSSSRCDGAGTCNTSSGTCSFPYLCTNTLSGSKIATDNTAFTAPGATISTSPGTDASPPGNGTYSIPVRDGTYTVISSVPAGFAVSYSVNGGAWVSGTSVAVAASGNGTVNVSWKYTPVAKLVVSGTTPVGACSGGSITVTAQDANGNTAFGYAGTVHLSTSDPHASLPPDYTFTAGDNGTHQFQNVVLRSSRAIQFITATDLSSPAVSGTMSNITVTPGPAATLVVSGPASSSACSSLTLTVDAYDACDQNQATTYTGPVHFASTDAQATLPADAALKAGHGTFTAGAALHTAGNQKITVSDAAGAALAAPPLAVAVAACDAVSLVLTGISSPRSACAPASVDVSAVDAFHNIVTGYLGTIAFASTDPAAILPSGYTFTAADKGHRRFPNGVVLKSSGTALKTVTVGDTANGAISAQASALVTPGAAASITVSGVASPATACTPGDLVVKAFDSCLPGVNVAAGYLGTVVFSSDDARASLPASYTFTTADSGAHTFAGGAMLKTPGVHGVTATDTKAPGLTSLQSGINVIAASGAASIALTGLSTNVPAGAVESPTVTVTESCGNRAASYTGTVHFTSSDPYAVLPSDYTFLATDNGTHTFPGGVTVWTVGDQSFKVADTVVSSLSAVVDAHTNPGACRTGPPTGAGGTPAQGTQAKPLECQTYVCVSSNWVLQPVAKGTACANATAYVDLQCNQTQLVCDGAGGCGGQPLADGTACNDSNACTSGEACHAGVCGQPTSTVTCPLPDQCHAAGLCNPSTGICSNPAKPSGTACDDGNSCTSGDHCDVNAICVGTLSCAPGVPGTISAPTTNMTGSYAVSWGAATGVVAGYDLFENGAGIYSVDAQTLSVNITGRGDGNYVYQARACNSAGCSALSQPTIATVLFLPGTPGSIAAPPESGPSYTLTWGASSGTVSRYELDESTSTTPWVTTPSLVMPPPAEAFFTGKLPGQYSYRVRACNASGCSANTATQAVEVIKPSPSMVADEALIPSSPSDQQWIGAIAGAAEVEGGAATYSLPVAIPPGRAGMQPEVALRYSSRNGNGIAGVGWTVSASSTIYRCPRTLAQEGGNRPVQLDSLDRLCFDGQRLVGDAQAYGQANSEYRTEIDRFDRITLSGGDMGSWSSTFTVEHKSGRISVYESLPYSNPPASPTTWYLTRERDRQGNCIRYNWVTPYDEDHHLDSISYTGTTAAGGGCMIDAGARSVNFVYTFEREDKRSTSLFGAYGMHAARLSAIQTMVGTQAVRRYQLAYKMSGATRRSLLAGVTLCGGGSCGVEKLPPTTFAYQETPPTYQMQRVQLNGQPLSDDWRLVPMGDLDGDGTRDVALRQISTGGRSILLSSCGLVSGVDQTQWWAGFGNPADATPFRGYADMNGDGRVDVLGTVGGKLAFATLSCPNRPAVLWTNNVTDLPISASNVSPSMPIDYDGDGIMDLRYVDNYGEHIILHGSKDPLKWSNNIRVIDAPTPPAGFGVQSLRDINGDGLVDTIFDPSTYNNPDDVTAIAFFDGSTFQTRSLFDAGGPKGQFLRIPSRRWIDVNGDGLPDLYDNGTLWINRGGPRTSATMFARGSVTLDASVNAGDLKRTDQALVMDVDGDGREELLVPISRVPGYEYCGGDSTKRLPSGDPAVFCGEDFELSPYAGPYRNLDRSVFYWKAFKFLERGDGSYLMVAVPGDPNTGGSVFMAPINYPIDIFDSNGDGLPDVSFRLINAGGPGNAYQFLKSTDMGPYISRSQAPAPDLLLTVTEGAVLAASGKVTSSYGPSTDWRYQPLSNGQLPSECVNDLNKGQPFYVAHNDVATTPGYSYFTSSMWTVSRMSRDNGIGSGKNATCYRYQDAMLNTEGRGFQGFKVIIAEQQMPLAAVEDATNAAAGCGGTCSKNNLRTTSEFFQEFPFAGKLSRVTVGPLAGTFLSQTQYWWSAQDTSLGAVVVHGAGSQEVKNEIAGGQVSQSTNIVQLDTASGEPTTSCSIVAGSSSVIKTEIRALQPPDISKWWLGKLVSRDLTSDLFSGSINLAAAQLSCPNHPLWTSCANNAAPVCPAGNGTDSKRLTVDYTWFDDDGSGSGQVRELQKETLSAGTAKVFQSSTLYTYDAFGNVATKTVSGTDAGNDPSWPAANPGTPTQLPPTIFAFTDDHYFHATETNPAGHVATLQTDAATGLLVSHQAVQGGPITAVTYDSLGRLTAVTASGQPRVDKRVRSCSAGDCALIVWTGQPGSPTSVEYLDRLGRVIATGVEGFDGKEILARVAFNERGIKIAEYEPVSTGNPVGSWDGQTASSYVTQYSSIDMLGRPGKKTVSRAAAIFESGAGDSSFVTTYQYSAVAAGTQTCITAQKSVAEGGALIMSRTYDEHGKLANMVQRAGASCAAGPAQIVTTYRYDSAGNLTKMIDSRQNAIVATFDDLGQERAIDDPDRGHWEYTWDGLGRLRTQTNARKILVAYQYDSIGRLERRFMRRPGDTAAKLEANWQYDLNDRRGTLGALLGVADTTGGSLADAQGDSRLYYHRDYTYDDLLRPVHVTTHVPAGPSWAERSFSVDFAYDANYGRVKAMSHPSGELVAFNHDSRGNLLGESPMAAGGTRGANPYRNVTGMSPRGQVTAQKFGNGIIESNTFDPSTGLVTGMAASGLMEIGAQGGCQTTPGAMVKQLAYTYDQFLNLKRQTKQVYQRDDGGSLLCNAAGLLTLSASETYGYDELQRLTGTSRSWSNGPPQPPTTSGEIYVYDDLGNITAKSDYADQYTYSASRTNGSPAGPHAVGAVFTGGALKGTFTYDENGNMVQSTGADGRTIAFDNFDRPTKIVMGTTTTLFQYAPDGTRYLQQVTTSANTKTVYHVDKGYELVTWSNGPDEEKTYVAPDVIVIQSGSSRDVRYLHLDRLGSVEAVTTTSGAEFIADARSFDAFGKPRSRDWQGQDKLHRVSDFNKTTERGFTGHEHLDDIYLIHMNGRVYDYRLGRFFSVDPFISDPANSQSINPYSYIGNNPLSGVDPTGYQAECILDTGSHICGGSTIGPRFDLGTPGGKGSGERNGASVGIGQKVPVSEVGSPSDTKLVPGTERGRITSCDPKCVDTEPTWRDNRPGALAQGAAISLGTQGASDAAVRAKYASAVSKLDAQNLAYNADRDALKLLSRSQTTPGGRALIRAMRPAGRPRGLGGRANVSNLKVNSAMRAVGLAGKAVAVVGVAVSGYNIVTAPEEQTARVVAQEGGAWAGALSFGAAGGYAGVKAGALVGAWFGGAGAVPGAVIGLVGGSLLGGAYGAIWGRQAADNIVDLTSGP